MHRTTTIKEWSIAIVLLVVSGCSPPEPEAPTKTAPKPAPQAAPAESQAVEPAQPQAAITPERPAAEGGPQLVPPANTPVARADDSEPRGRTTFYRGDAGPAEIPPVVLSKSHEALCRVKVGDTMPEIELPQIDGGDNRENLADFAGEKATVVVFWAADRRMSHEQLADLNRDVVEQFGDHGVAVVGIAVEESDQSAEHALRRAGATFPNLVDHDGDAFAKVGSDRLPRTYLVDADGKILWFDIEYSLTTRRELNRALRAVVGEAQ